MKKESHPHQLNEVVEVIELTSEEFEDLERNEVECEALRRVKTSPLLAYIEGNPYAAS